MQPRDRLTAKEVQVATLVWQGLTNKDVAAVLHTSEQVVKNYLRTAFDKLGVWTRLELALYVAGHGGANWHVPPGNGLLPPGAELGAAPLEVRRFPDAKPRDRAHELGNERPSAAGQPRTGSIDAPCALCCRKAIYCTSRHLL